MSTSSQKQTKPDSVSSKNGSWVIHGSETTSKSTSRSATPNKFAGMSKNIEEVKPVVIRGYKTRG
ncbi:MAG TPA: hypothetical protein DIT07_08855 [Sphingobacteriaceae bacterium]|nr:hypothetical protein [Sphingobacteriaceae bacterium]